MTTKNHAIDKDGKTVAMSWFFMGDGLVFSPANDRYKAQRKHLAHAFYKNQMRDMQEMFK